MAQGLLSNSHLHTGEIDCRILDGATISCIIHIVVELNPNHFFHAFRSLIASHRIQKSEQRVSIEANTNPHHMDLDTLSHICHFARIVRRQIMLWSFFFSRICSFALNDIASYEIKVRAARGSKPTQRSRHKLSLCSCHMKSGRCVTLASVFCVLIASVVSYCTMSQGNASF